MRNHPKNRISSETALDLLRNGQPIVDAHVEGDLVIETIDNWEKEVVMENSIVEHFRGNMTRFDQHVKLVNCHFLQCEFMFTYFFGGFSIENCQFDQYLDFQAGGHNKIGNMVIINDNDFQDFVNFFDCWFEEEVIVSGNRFCKGTNLLGAPKGIPVTFEKIPMIKNNQGRLDFDNEGIRH